MMRGNCTLVVARQGSRDPAEDLILLREIERALTLPSGTLTASAALARPEFRLAEGLSRATADNLARAALLHGFQPRVRERMGVKWSSERGPWPLLAATALLLVLWAAMGPALVALGVDVPMSILTVTGIPFFVLAYGFVSALWARSIYLPLLVPTARIPVDRSEVVLAAYGSSDALVALSAAIARAPAHARSDLEITHRELVARVQSLSAQARQSDHHPEALQRKSAIVAELVGIRDTVLGAVHDLGDDHQRDTPTERLRQQVDNLARAEAESSAGDAAQRHRRALQSGKR